MTREAYQFTREVPCLLTTNSIPDDVGAKVKQQL